MSGLRYAVDDRKADAVAHLAAARTQNTGPAFWVTAKDKGGRLVRPLFHIILRIFFDTGTVRASGGLVWKRENRSKSR